MNKAQPTSDKTAIEQLWRRVGDLETKLDNANTQIAELSLSLANVPVLARKAFIFDNTLKYNSETNVLGVNQPALNKSKMGGV